MVAANGQGVVDPIEFGFQYPYAAELRDFFRSYESNVGFRSTFSAMLASLAGVQMGSGPPAGWDPYAEAIDRIGKGSVVYRTLQRMSAEPEHVTVLVRLYGGRAEGDWYADFGELAPLAIMTKAALELRESLAVTEGEHRAELAGASVAESQQAAREQLCEDFWIEASRRARDIARHDRLVERLDKLQRRANEGDELSVGQLRTLTIGDAQLRDVAGRIAAADDLLGKILDAYLYDGETRARIGAMIGADHEITTADVVRRMLRQRKGNQDRAIFVAEVKREGHAMRKAAHAAYKLARKAV